LQPVSYVRYLWLLPETWAEQINLQLARVLIVLGNDAQLD
jgi:hypothetical protein